MTTAVRRCAPRSRGRRKAATPLLGRTPSSAVSCLAVPHRSASSAANWHAEEFPLYAGECPAVCGEIPTVCGGIFVQLASSQSRRYCGVCFSLSCLASVCDCFAGVLPTVVGFHHGPGAILKSAAMSTIRITQENPKRSAGTASHERFELYKRHFQAPRYAGA